MKHYKKILYAMWVHSSEIGEAIGIWVGTKTDVLENIE